MPRYRKNLPQLGDALFLTDGGLETTLVFHEGFDLPLFAAFVLLANDRGCDTLRDYYRTYANIAREYHVGFILESMTWRASAAWGKKIGYSPAEMVDFNCKAIDLLTDIRREYENDIPHIIISGCIGPRNDGYRADSAMTIEGAEAYHRTQIATFRKTEADMVSAFTIPSTEEAIGISLAAKLEEMPVVISFTVETDGSLPSGESLKKAVEKVDSATGGTPLYYMVNCAHPTHFVNALDSGSWTERIRAIRANASCKSHEELDEASDLDEGNRQDLTAGYLLLRDRLSNLNVLGGCCGTDHRHVAEIFEAFVGLPATSKGTIID